MAETAEARIDLNADVGEGYDDAPMFSFLSSVNVACGAHAGGADTMRATVQRAAGVGLSIGAHPSFPDREGFGRRVTTTDPAEIVALVREQTENLAKIAGAEGISLSHVKPHGALYNLAASNRAAADAVAAAVASVDAALALVGLAGSHSLAAAKSAGLVTIAEGFVDRGYRDDGSLAPRDTPGAVISDPDLASLRAVALARSRRIESVSGRPIEVAAESLCLHGDTPGSVVIARRVHAALREAGVTVMRPGKIAGR